MVHRLGSVEVNAMTKVTSAQLLTAQKNDISKSSVYARLYKGWNIDDAITVPTSKKMKRATQKGGRIIAGRFLTHDQLEQAMSTGISETTLHYRLRVGWDIERVITTPPMHRKNPQGENAGREMSKDEIVAIIGRIKTLNRSEMKDFPVTIPKPIKKKMKQYGLNFEDIAPLKVVNMN